ncbi:acetyltransferase [Luteipulveratus halotolerans]|uniref:[Ribosomal protein bS18]-alanine N-acetyltransferase n=2 Tax=Luteipulveratus halotolerans TaxID=1631356 RepID=A0A0L6CNY9_9MICO|nr:acetyltransferase [Luteipulveratus halotolerans]
MRWGDIDTLVSLEQALFAGDAWTAESWWGELAGRPRRAYVVAESAGDLVGYAGVDQGGDVADVMTVAVAPAAQGAGLGQRLMDWMTATVRDSGAESLLLEVRADNDAARKLYDRNGFEQISVRRRYYGDVDAVILRRLLKEEDRG